MSATIAIDELRVGMFVHLDLGWWAHPFALSSFMVTSADQIATIRGLGLKQLRWSPEKSREEEAPSVTTLPVKLDAAPPTPPTPPAALGMLEPTQGEGGGPHPDSAELDEAAQAQHALALQRQADRLCVQQYNEAGQAWVAATKQVRDAPEQARETAQGLTHSLLHKMMIDGEVCIRMLSDSLGDTAGAHALNVAVISMLMGRVFGLVAQEMEDMGVGALMHDIGKIDLPDRVRHADAQLNTAEHAKYRDHVALGLLHGKRMGLSPGAMLVLAQHHEMADGSGFPQQLNIDRMTVAARIVCLVNRYDNLCNPSGSAPGMTPHEALSLIFAQAKSKFDVSMLNAFIRMMGVYPPGSVVQLTDDRYASVVSCNSTRPLKPRVLVCDPGVPVAQALLLNLEQQPNLGIRRSIKSTQLPAAVRDYLSPRARVAYFFEPAVAASQVVLETELAA